MNKSWIKTVILKQFYPLFLLTFGIAFALVVKNHVEVRAIVLEDMTLESANIYANSIKTMRGVYSENVMNKAKLNGMKVSHEFRGKDDTLPLPISFSQMYVDKVKVDGINLDARVVSFYPFPWNQGRNLDVFEKEALEYLSKKPEETFFRFEQSQAGKVVRFAVSDVMSQQCVDCHNSHSQSPKTDWKEGDVRGIVSVAMPIRTSDFTGVSHIRENVISLIFIISLYLFVGYQLMLWIRRE